MLKINKLAFIILGTAVLVIAYFLISPLFVNKEINEKLEDIQPVPEPMLESTSPSVLIQAEPEIISVGNFSGLAGHDAEGTAKLIKNNGKYYVRFENDFRVTNGPDLFVYFGKNGNHNANAIIAELKGNIGGQNYEVPNWINVEDYNEVWVWCRAFAVPFGKAVLK